MDEAEKRLERLLDELAQSLNDSGTLVDARIGGLEMLESLQIRQPDGFMESWRQVVAGELELIGQALEVQLQGALDELRGEGGDEDGS